MNFKKVIFTFIVIIINLLYNKDVFAQNNSEKVNSINDINKNVVSNPSIAIEEATEFLNQSYQNNNKLNQGQAYNTLGTIYFNSAQYQKAASYFEKAETVLVQCKDEKSLNYARKYLAESYQMLKSDKKYEETITKIERKSKSKSESADYKLKKARNKRSNGKSDEAIEDLEEVVEDKKGIISSKKIDIYLELGDLYLERKDTTKGLEYIQMAKVEADKLNKESNVFIQNYDNLDKATPSAFIGNTYNNIAQILTKNNLLDDNKKIQETFINIPSKDINFQVLGNYNIGNSFLIQNQASKAIPYLETSANMAKVAGLKPDLIKATESLSKAYEKNGDYQKALETYKKYIILVDSFKRQEINKSVEKDLLNAKFTIQEGKIKELETKQLEKEKKLYRQSIIIFSLVFGLSILVGLIYYLNKNIKQKHKANLQIRMQSLRSQMNPHFIFNSLNSVNNFISNNDERKANQYISQFSKLMRTVMKNSNADFINLDQEIDILKLYLELEHERFSDKFDYEIEIDPNIEFSEIAIPPMLIQPYIENAIWHGLRYKNEKGFLKLEIKNIHQLLTISITDNGIGRKKSNELKTTHQKEHSSTGMKNTKERIDILTQLNKINIKVDIIDLDCSKQTGTQVIIKIPIQQLELI